MDKNKEIETNKKQEQTTERETSALFCKAFYDEAREIEARAQKVDLEVDENRMEAMYQRMMAKMASGNASAENSGEKSEAMAESTSEKVVTLPRKSLRHMLRWVAVLALVCAGVFGVSMQSQAGKDGLWSSIQRLIGVESRLEQKNNGDEREYSDPEELKAIRTIESELDVNLPEFFYWPGKINFVDAQINRENNSFILMYEIDDRRIYFEGETEERDASEAKSWEGEGTTEFEKYDGVKYQIVTIKEDDTAYYYVSWNANNMRYVLSGMEEGDELKKILKNIKN